MTTKQASAQSVERLSHSFQWEKLTSPGFAKAVRKTQGVCIVPIGCLERHGGHLPLGTDTLLAQAFVNEAITKEPAVVFPPLYFGWIHEATHHPGAIALPTSFMLELLELLCDEIARNGFKKIILMSYHGGNHNGLNVFLNVMLEKQRKYTLYYINPGDVYPIKDLAWQAMRTMTNDGHGGDDETSVLMACHPQLVNMKSLSKPGRPLGRLAHLGDARTAMNWYADYPDQYSGNARTANLKKGNYLFNYAVKRLVMMIRAVKKDKVAPKLQNEFFARRQHQYGV